MSQEEFNNQFGGYDDDFSRELSDALFGADAGKHFHMFTRRHMTEEEVDVVESKDPEVISNFFKMLRAGGEIPKDWPDLNLRVIDSGDCVGADMHSLVFMVCLYHSTPKADGRGYKLLPSSPDEVKDWIWSPTEHIGFVYLPSAKGLRACIGQDLVTLKALQKSLAEATLAPLRPLSDIPEEINLADILVSEARAAHEHLDKETCEALERRAVELLGVTPEESRGYSVNARNSVWNYILSKSPRFDIVRTVVHHAKAGEPGELFFTKMLLSVDELLQEGFVSRTALAAGKDEIRSPGTATVVVSDGDPAFEFYKEHEVWDQMQYAAINTSPAAAKRLALWEEQVTASFKAPPLG